MSRLSGPLLDRVDLHVEVPSLSYTEIADTRRSGPTSAQVRGEVQAARNRQLNRYGNGFASNAHVDPTTLRRHCPLDAAAESLLETAIDRLGFSARAYDKVLRVARTLADLEAQERIAQNHIAEAIQYRSLDRQLF